MLLWLLIRGVLIPIRRMVADADLFAGGDTGTVTEPEGDELRLVGRHFRALMTDVAKTRLTLAESRSRLLSAERLASVGKLAASVAHEMRNPLSSMKMWLYSIRKTTSSDPALDRKLGILSEEINRLESIVRNFLEFSRPPAVKLQPCSVLQVMEKTLEIVHPWLDTKNIRVLQDHAHDLPQVRADPEQLKQVFANLLDNAAAAMPGGGEISISSSAEADGAGCPWIAVRIRDTGPGIPDDVRARMFEPFFTTKDDGTGLGLCIAANIMVRHGGQLILESSTSRGTTFAVRVPSGFAEK